MFRLKENWFYLLRRFEGSEKLGKQLRKATDVNAYKSITAEIFHTLPLQKAFGRIGDFPNSTNRHPTESGMPVLFLSAFTAESGPCHCEQSIRIQNVLIQEAVANAVLRPAQECNVFFLHRIGAIGNIVAGCFAHACSASLSL